MNEPRVRLVQVDDWKGLYVDGQLIYEGDSLPGEMALRLMLDHGLIPSYESEWLGEDGTGEEILGRFGYRMPQHYSEFLTSELDENEVDIGGEA